MRNRYRGLRVEKKKDGQLSAVKAGGPEADARQGQMMRLRNASSHEKRADAVHSNMVRLDLRQRK